MKYHSLFKHSSLAIFVATTFNVTATTPESYSLVNKTLVKKASDNEISVDETIVVTANRTIQVSKDTLSSISILSRDDIESSPAQSVGELLSEVNGLQVSNEGGAGQSASVYSRGTNTGHMLVIVDGQRISSATLGQVAFANISIDQIEHIEIIKGPRASIWGSDAVGGVIQIFTRQLNAGEVAFDLGLGNFSQQQLSLSTAIGHGDGATTVSVAHRHSEGYDVLESAEPDDDGYERSNYAVNGFQQLDPQWRIHWLAKYDKGNTEYDNKYGGANENSLTTMQWQVGAKQINQGWLQQFSLGQQDNETVHFGNGTQESAGSFFKTQRLKASWLGRSQLSQQLAATLGIDWISEEVKTKTAYDKTERDSRALFAHLGYDNDLIIAEGSLRLDDVQGVDSEVTYNVSVGYHLNNSSLVSLNFGHAFKAPSFNALYLPKTQYSYGNPDLIAETSDSIELLYKNSGEFVTTELSLYRTDIDNLIEWIEEANWVNHPLNIAKAKIKGAELTLEVDALGFNHVVQLAYVDAKNASDNTQLIRRAKHTASYQVAYDWQRFSVQANWQYRGKRQDSEYPATIELPSYSLVNASASYELDNQWQVGLKVNNIFDKEYVSANHYIGQPAQYLLTLSYRR